MVQITWLPLNAPPLLALEKVTFAGKASVTVTLAAMDGPILETVMM